MKSLGLIKKALVGSIATLCIASIAYGEELKVCETKQDKISGCIEMIEGEAQLFVNTKLVATIKYTNDKFVSGKCTNGKALSKSGLFDAISSPNACSGGYVCPAE
ncbi:hypothetical protein [Helicobacter bilis]|uniref:hypothetical protein n=1 Tax=Helicobacter bilis TaxID=37372 RepID=UPI000CF17884|nr:hypothetical protein [Helicobacter bilis]